MQNSTEESPGLYFTFAKMDRFVQQNSSNPYRSHKKALAKQYEASENSDSPQQYASPVEDGHVEHPSSARHGRKSNNLRQLNSNLDLPSADDEESTDGDPTPVAFNSELQDGEQYSDLSKVKPSTLHLQNGQKVINDDVLTRMAIPELNKLLKGLPNEIVRMLKLRRRTLKNRGYAKNCRNRRVEQKETLETASRDLQAVIDNTCAETRKKRQQLRDTHQEIADLIGKLKSQGSRAVDGAIESLAEIIPANKARELFR